MSKKAQSRREATKQNVGQSNEGEEVGDGKAGESPATGNGGQAAISLTPDTDVTGFGSSLDSIPSTLLRKWSSHV